MSRDLVVPNWLSFPAGPGPFTSAPLGLRGPKMFPNATDTTNATIMQVPTGYAWGDIIGATITSYVTAATGTTPTQTLTLQGTYDLTDTQTTSTSTFNSTAISFTVANPAGFSTGDYILVYDDGGIQLTNLGSHYEWMLITGIAGSVFTVMRAQYGTTAQNYIDPPFVAKSNSWFAIPTGNAVTPTMTVTSGDATSATVISPNILTLDMNTLGMSLISVPFLRVTITVGGTVIPTLAGYVNAAFRFNALTNPNTQL